MQVETQMVRRVSPEEQELAEKRLQLANLLSQLVDRELLLANFKAELAAFEGLYLREVGMLYAELDEWEAKIADLIASKEGTIAANEAAASARKQADESRAAANNEVAMTPAFKASPELKSLYREVVRSVHPDRANGEVDRFLRERLMKQASEAYACGDAEVLRKIIDAYANSPESVQGIGVAADLERVIREIKQIAKRLLEIDGEIVGITVSDMAQLRKRYDDRLSRSGNLLSEMAADVRSQIEGARARFERFSAPGERA
jgi:hypothetical protein